MCRARLGSVTAKSGMSRRRRRISFRPQANESPYNVHQYASQIFLRALIGFTNPRCLRAPSTPLFKSLIPNLDVATNRDVFVTHEYTLIFLDLHQAWPLRTPLHLPVLMAIHHTLSSASTRKRPRLGPSERVDRGRVLKLGCRATHGMHTSRNERSRQTQEAATKDRLQDGALPFPAFWTLGRQWQGPGPRSLARRPGSWRKTMNWMKWDI
jgi:hypothetical protein